MANFYAIVLHCSDLCLSVRRGVRQSDATHYLLVDSEPIVSVNNSGLQLTQIKRSIRPVIIIGYYKRLICYGIFAKDEPKQSTRRTALTAQHWRHAYHRTGADKHVLIR